MMIHRIRVKIFQGMSLFGTPPLAGENPTYGGTEGLYIFRENMSSSRISAVKVPRTAVWALYGPIRTYLSHRIGYFRGFQALKKRLTSSRFFSTVFPTAKVSIRINARVTRVFIFFNLQSTWGQFYRKSAKRCQFPRFKAASWEKLFFADQLFVCSAIT